MNGEDGFLKYVVGAAGTEKEAAITKAHFWVQKDLRSCDF